jgi:hypothetical protein
VVVLDLRTAFDAISHRILLNKLAYCAFAMKVIKWLASYRCVRAGYVYSSQLVGFMGGVGLPQRSVLSPLLFNVYVNDLSEAVTRSIMAQHADDTTALVESRRSGVDFVGMVECTVNEITQLPMVNSLQVSLAKTGFVVFG